MNTTEPESESFTQPTAAKWINRGRLVLFLGLLGVLTYLLMIGYGPDAETVQKLLVGIKESSWELPAVIMVFVVMGLVGTPQFILIAACVYAFGPLYGGLFSWAGTMVSASLHFWLGRWIGAVPMERFGGKNISRIVEFVSKNGFWASLLVRVVPSGPFIFVNLALGVSRAKFVQFVIGTALGINPKILAIAFVGQGLLSFSRQQSISLIMLFFALAGLTMVGIWLLRRTWKSRRNQLR